MAAVVSRARGESERGRGERGEWGTRVSIVVAGGLVGRRECGGWLARGHGRGMAATVALPPTVARG